MDEIVMYIIVRSDLGMTKGKIAAQVGHAVQLAMRAAEQTEEGCEWLAAWEGGSYAKIVLRVEGEDALLSVMKQLIAILPSAYVVDEGRTEIPAGTITAVGVVPAPKGLVASALEGLRLL